MSSCWKKIVLIKNYSKRRNITMRKLALIFFLAITLATVPALAGDIPEFDAVGNDSQNFFNDFIKESVVANNIDRFGNLINNFSDWELAQLIQFDLWDPATWPTGGAIAGSGFAPFELFFTSSGQLQPDPCFPGYLSALTAVQNYGLYQWVIVLQMKPQSDLDINIRDCVLKPNQFDIWMAAEQTGRYRMPWGELIFDKYANPDITAFAIPGPFATAGFDGPFGLDARKMPTLYKTSLYETRYTSKALWEEGLVAALPATGCRNENWYREYDLHQGDMIYVQVQVPGSSTADIWYGPDNVIVKYIGIVGTWFTVGTP
jgi:hypothetical protein